MATLTAHSAQQRRRPSWPHPAPMSTVAMSSAIESVTSSAGAARPQGKHAHNNVGSAGCKRPQVNGVKRMRARPPVSTWPPPYMAKGPTTPLYHCHVASMGDQYGLLPIIVRQRSSHPPGRLIIVSERSRTSPTSRHIRSQATKLRCVRDKCGQRRPPSICFRTYSLELRAHVARLRPKLARQLTRLHANRLAASPQSQHSRQRA